MCGAESRRLGISSLEHSGYSLENMMGKSLRIKSLAAAVSLAFVASTGVLTASAATSNASQSTSATKTYIVTFAEPGMLHYSGGTRGIQATSPRALGQRKLDVHTDAARQYGEFLAAQRDAYLASIQTAIGRPLNVTHSYAIARNGIAAEMSAAEATAIARIPGVQSVRVAKDEHLDTYRGPAFIGADTIWDGTNVPGNVPTKGEGIVAGVLDGGTNSDHPSFANDPLCGFDASDPKLVAVDCSTSSGGLCSGANPEANAGYGHGVHTSSTVAGNTIDNTAVPPPALPDGMTMSGVAPCAAIRHYKVCQTNSCSGAAIAAAIDNALADGVDVLNFSISGGTSPWADNDRGFLDLVENDTFVAASAGNNSNDDPTVVGRVNHRGPWVMTVAASTHDTVVGPNLTVTGPGTPAPETQGVALNPGSTTTSTPTLTGSPIASYPANIEGCTASGGIPAGTFAGAIAVVRRGTCTFTEKITNASNAGAIAVVIGNNQAGSINMDTSGAPAVPAYSVLQVNGDAIIAHLAANPTSSTADLIPVGESERQGDVLADFSYRGPTPAPLADLTKPDITAPGVDIYAATDDTSGNYEFMSGTSMSGPHTAGAGALVRAAQPSWSVTEVKSAIMTTATRNTGFQEDGVTNWNIDDVGSGRVDLTKAVRAGLTLDETIANYLAANPSGGSINVKELNLPALRNLNCSPDCTFTRTFKSQLATSGTWNVGTVSDGSFTVTATPATFTLAPGAEQEVEFVVAPDGDQSAAIAFGYVTLTENAGQSPEQHLTVAIRGDGTPPVVDIIFQDGFDGEPEGDIVYSEYWDTYATGSNAHGQGGWEGWQGDSAAGATIVDTQASTAPNSVDISDASDLVQQLTGFTSGQYVVSAKQYIPSGSSGESYFLLLNNYDDSDPTCAACNWSLQVNFNLASGTLLNEGPDGGTATIVTDQWVDIRVEIDLDNDTQTFFYNGTQVFAGSWTDGMSGGGSANIGAIDLFANSATSVYYDDIVIEQITP